MKLPELTAHELREPEIGLPEDWERIEEALRSAGHDPPPREKLWRELRLIWALYLGSGDISPDIRPSAVRAALSALKCDAARLFFDLEPSGELTKPAGEAFEEILNERTVFRIDDPPAIKPEDRRALAYASHYLVPSRQALLGTLAELISAVDEARAMLPADMGGRQEDWRLQGTIRALARFYKRSTGRNPGISRPPTGGEPSGPFFRFVVTFLQTFAPDRATALSGDALAKAIQRTLKTSPG